MRVTFVNKYNTYVDLEVRIGNSYNPLDNNPLYSAHLNQGERSGPYTPNSFLFWRKKSNMDGAWSSWVDEATGYDDKTIEF